MSLTKIGIKAGMGIMNKFGDIPEKQTKKEKIELCLEMLEDSYFIELKNDKKNQLTEGLNNINNLEQLDQISDSIAVLVNNLSMLNGLSNEEDVEKARKIIQDQLEFVEAVSGVKLIVVNSIFE